MANNIIRYLFGAGASAGNGVNTGIPTVNNFEEILHDLGNILSENEIRGLVNELDFQDLKNLVEMVRTVAKESAATFSIDTLARKYWLRNSQVYLNNIKTSIALALTLRQFTCQHDTRYDIFISSLLDAHGSRRRNFPSTIDIYTWNYDFQFEMSYLNILNEAPYKIFKWQDKILESLNIKRLNGSCVNPDIEPNLGSGLLPLKNIEFVKLNSQLFIDCAGSSSSNSAWGGVSFSWENRKDTFQQVEQADVLVIIGYSFPTFNREFDQNLLSTIKETGKIYIQCSFEKDGVNHTEGNEEVVTKLKGMGANQEIITLSTSKEFFIPFEYNKPVS